MRFANGNDGRHRFSGRLAGRSVPSELLFLAGLFAGLFCALLADRLSRDREIELVRVVRDLAAREFVSDTDGGQMVDNALRGMLQGLDRHSNFYGHDELARLERENSGEFRGIGVVFRPPVTDGQVLFSFPGSPAWRAGARVGDRIVAIDGATIEGLAPGELQRSLQDPARSTLEIDVEGLDGERRKLVVHPELVLDPTVRHVRMLDPEHGIGYVSIAAFSRQTPPEFDRAVQLLEQEGLRSLVIDLRGNPGGILDAAVAIANRFIREGTIVTTEERRERHVSVAVPEEATLAGMPLVLLIDGGSASASEVLAGAVQDRAVGALVGESSYGKGTVQTLTKIGEDRAMVKLTTAHYLTPSGRRIERRETDSGLAPDLLVTSDPAERQRVHEYLGSYSPPPETLAALESWERSEGVELVARPPHDRQLDAARDLLRGVRPSHARAAE